MIRPLAGFTGLAIAFSLTSSCGLLADCTDYDSHEDILESWIGVNLVEYERAIGLRPTSTAQRPQYRTEYSYRTAYDPQTGDSCIDRMVVDDASGNIVSWSYQGNMCYGHCNARG
jgi:hypothetical protein